MHVVIAVLQCSIQNSVQAGAADHTEGPRMPPAEPSASAPAQPMSLVDLPDTCLLAVLQRLQGNTQDVLSARLTHSRLQQLAVLALTSIHTRVTQPHVDSLLWYLGTYGQHIQSLDLYAEDTHLDAVSLQQLPDTLTQLQDLQFSGGLSLQLQPGLGSPGVLRAPAGMPLLQLHLHECVLLDGPEALAAALSQLPTLEVLSVVRVTSSDGIALLFPTEAVSQLQQLRTLALHEVYVRGGASAYTALQPDTRLVRLEIDDRARAAPGFSQVTASMLAGASQLTRLELFAHNVAADVLAGKTQLQHLTLRACRVSPNTDRAGATAQLLSQLQDLQQLTHLNLFGSCEWHSYNPGTPLTARAYAGLTASTHLAYLNFTNNPLMPGAWKHMFPDGRQLPHLRELHIDCIDGNRLDTAELTRLGSSCPNLEVLKGNPWN